MLKSVKNNGEPITDIYSTTKHLVTWSALVHNLYYREGEKRVYYWEVKVTSADNVDYEWISDLAFYTEEEARQDAIRFLTEEAPKLNLKPIAHLAAPMDNSFINNETIERRIMS